MIVMMVTHALLSLYDRVQEDAESKQKWPPEFGHFAAWVPIVGYALYGQVLRDQHFSAKVIHLFARRSTIPTLFGGRS